MKKVKILSIIIIFSLFGHKYSSSQQGPASYDEVIITGKYDITATVEGGGLSGQAGAVKHGISRAIVDMNSDLRVRLKKEGFLRRDPREKERKKYGQKGARKRFQFSKR